MGVALFIWDNPALAEVNLPLLIQSSGNHWIFTNPGLQVINLPNLELADPGNIIVNGNAALTSLNFDCLERTGPVARESFNGQLSVEQSPLITSLVFPRLQHVGHFFHAIGLSGLTVLQADRVETSGTVLIDGCDSLPTASFAALTYAIGVTVRNNQSITSITMPLLERTDFEVGFYNNPSLSSLGLGALRLPAFLVIDNNDALTSLAGLENVTEVGNVAIGFNDALTSIAALENLAQSGNFVVRNNAQLTTLGLAQFATTTGTFNILNNDALTTLGVPMLTRVDGALDVLANPMLPGCEGVDLLERVLAAGNTPSSANITQNAGCCEGTFMCSFSSCFAFMCP